MNTKHKKKEFRTSVHILVLLFLQVDGTDDTSDFHEMVEAMKTMKIDDNDRSEIFAIVCAILHLGNVVFSEGNNDQAFVQTKECK